MNVIRYLANPGGMASSSRPCLPTAQPEHGLEDDAMPPGKGIQRLIVKGTFFLFFFYCFTLFAQVSFETRVPGNLFYPTDSVMGEIKAVAPVSSRDIHITAKVFDARKRLLVEIPAVILSAQNHFTAAIQLPKGLGYYQILFKDEKEKSWEGRYAVIPANPCLNKKEAESPFGVQTHFNQWWPTQVGKVVKRVGIAWIRDGEASLDEKALPVTKENHLCYLPAFTLHKDPSWIKKDNQGRWDFSEAVEFHRKYAEKYGSDIDYYDLMNEPAAVWGPKFGGSWNGGEWQKVFVEYGTQVTQALKKADPTAKVLWEDLDMLLYYRQFYDLGAAPMIDIISPHAYNLHRTRPLPEEQPILEQLSEFRQFVKEHNLPWKLWHGEVGFTTFQLSKTNPPPFYTPCSELQQAQNLVRMMVLHLSRGVEKIFWYDFMDDGVKPEECEHHFGLIRNDQTPKPAVAAYANLIHQLRGGKWMGKYLIGGHADAYAFVAERTGKPVLIAWVRRGVIKEMVPVPSQATELTIMDIYGGLSKVPVRNHKVELDLSPSPVYITGLVNEDLKPYISVP